MTTQTFDSSHFTDDDSRPAGGMTLSTGLTIEWQNGPLGTGSDRQLPNGCFVETVIAAAKDRLEYYQTTPFVCAENVAAIACLDNAITELQSRTSRRELAGIEGTYAEDPT